MQHDNGPNGLSIKPASLFPFFPSHFINLFTHLYISTAISRVSIFWVQWFFFLTRNEPSARFLTRESFHVTIKSPCKKYWGILSAFSIYLNVEFDDKPLPKFLATGLKVILIETLKLTTFLKIQPEVVHTVDSETFCFPQPPPTSENWVPVLFIAVILDLY